MSVPRLRSSPLGLTGLLALLLVVSDSAASRAPVVEGRGAPYPMSVNFMGLTGPQGVLPLYYSALVRDRLRARDHGLKRFLDIFNHRLISLFHRAWGKSRIHVDDEAGHPGRFTQHLLDLLGLGGPALRNRLGLRDEALVYYAGLLGPTQRGAAGLEQLIEDFFRVPVTVEQFVGGWHPVPASEQC